MNIRYRVTLTQCERDELGMLLGGGKHPARRLKRAQILLAADAGVGDEDIAAGIGVGGSTVYRTKRRFVEGNLEQALSEEPRPGAERKLTGKEEALLVATACSSPPEGRARWTLELLAGAMIKLTDHDRGRPSADAWPRTISSPGRRTCGASPRSTPSTSLAWRMCSTSMPSRRTRSGRWSASTKAPPSSSEKRASRSRPHRDGPNVSITS